MKRESLLILVGALLILSPFLGLPYTWLMFIVPGLALVVISIGVSLRLPKRVKDPEPYEAPSA